MDAVEFLEEQYRMCEALNSHCEECGLSYANNKTDHVCGDFIKRHPEEAVAIVAKWAKDHPLKTRQERFLEMFPHADAHMGLLTVCPGDIDMRYTCHGPKDCADCKKEYWLTAEKEDSYD